MLFGPSFSKELPSLVFTFSKVLIGLLGVGLRPKFQIPKFMVLVLKYIFQIQEPLGLV
jgi:hypothetical protein